MGWSCIVTYIQKSVTIHNEVHVPAVLALFSVVEFLKLYNIHTKYISMQKNVETPKLAYLNLLFNYC